MSYLEVNTPYDAVLEQGVLEAISRFAPHLTHVKTGTVIAEGRNRLICVNEKEAIEMATLVTVNDAVIVKYGQYVSIGQVNAMLLVKERTSVPVPEVFGFYENDNGYKYVVMEYLKGCDLQVVWDSLTSSQKEKFAKQLKPMFDELHSVKGTYIGGVGELSPEGRIFWGAKQKGPYESEADMNEAIIRADRNAWRQYGGSPPDTFINCTLPWLPRNHGIVLSHGQVCREHILVDVEREMVIGIVGWSEAGFFPEYWDCVLAICQTYWGCEWIKYIHAFLKPFPEEYALWCDILKRT